jgi:hypothetical protein
MLEWICSWLWPPVTNTGFFGDAPTLVHCKRDALQQVMPGFKAGAVISLLDKDEEQVKQALVAHVVNQMTQKQAAPTLLVLAPPSSTGAQQHLHRLIEHRAVSNTWVLLIQ